MMKKLCLFLILLFATPVQAEIVWYGDYETGDFLQWHRVLRNDMPDYYGTPVYGRPPQRSGEGGVSTYYGDGSLLTLVTDQPALEEVGWVISGPVRQGNYAAKFIVKSEASGGTEVDKKDCDPRGGGDCTKRRTEIGDFATTAEWYNAMPYLGENWVSFSFFVPLDWDDGGTDWGVILNQMKPLPTGTSPNFELQLKGTGWRISLVNDPTQTTLPWTVQPSGSIYRYHYSASEPPDVSARDSGLLVDFPNTVASRAALASVNKGGWTDWIMNVKWDVRGPTDGGTGFLKLWKREGAGAWVQVLDISPAIITRNGVDYERGIGYYAPARSGSNGGHGLYGGMYGAKTQFWGLADSRVIYNDNVKIGNAASTFSEMRPEGADPPVPLSRVPGVRLSGGIGWR